MERALARFVRADLGRKMVFLSGPRQAGKTTLARVLAAEWPGAQVLNWDVAADRGVIVAQSWSPAARLIVLDELHKMAGWKAWLKGVFDGRPDGQALLVTGSARLDTFRQSGESLAGRYFSWRLHPITVAEWVAVSGATAEEALARLLARGGFPEPFLAEDAADAERWRRLYLEGTIRDDILEFSRIGEIRAAGNISRSDPANRGYDGRTLRAGDIARETAGEAGGTASHIARDIAGEVAAKGAGGGAGECG